ncbi:MAG: glutamine--tRNA ligase/YqeY domain fusion protein [Bacillota bacterium]
MADNFIEEIIEADLERGRCEDIITRFPPEPNGYLHVGHAKSLCINFGIKEKYNGKCNLRFDDTNPVKEDVEYIDAIIEDIKWLGFEYDQILYASDYFDQIFEKAVLLIKKGLAFVCELNADEMREYRGTLTEAGKNSPYRDRSVEENLELFYGMRDGKYPDGSKVLRAKIDMSSPNINMRDPILYRVLRATHHRTGDKWCIYPMYDFTHPLSDAFEGITHSICTLEFEDHRPIYDWTIDNCDIEFKPIQREFARLNITNTIMSKRYLKKLVDDGAVDGWDDPRMPTICGMRRRGYPAAALKDFCGRIGVAKSNSEVNVKNLEACVRENLNENAMRAMAVKNPLLVEIVNYPNEESEVLSVENHPNHPEMGERELTFGKEIYIDRDDFALVPPPKYFRLKPDGYVRLKGAYIIKCEEVVLDDNGEVAKLKCSYVPSSKSGHDESGIKVRGVVQFVDKATCVPIVMRDFDYLLSDAEYNGQDFSERINSDSVHSFNALGEPSLKDVASGATFQFMRMGYYVFDKKSETYGEVVSLKDSFRF